MSKNEEIVLVADYDRAIEIDCPECGGNGYVLNIPGLMCPGCYGSGKRIEWISKMKTMIRRKCPGCKSSNFDNIPNTCKRCGGEGFIYLEKT